MSIYLSVGLQSVDRPRKEWRQPLSTGRDKKAARNISGRLPHRSGLPGRHARGAGRSGAALATYEPDVLAEDLEVVFCGINPATTAAAAGHNFSSGSNRFWTALYLAGLTDRRLPPHEARRPIAYRCG